MKIILIAIDRSAYSIKAAKTGVLLAKSLNAEISLVTIVDDRIIMSEGGITVSEILESAKKEAKETTQRILSMFNNPQAQVFIEEGKPAEKILEIAIALEPDIIVLGTHGRTGLNRALMGSVAEDVLRHSKIPVLVVPFKAINK